MNKKQILEFFREQNLPTRYAKLCNRFKDYENSKTPKKEELLRIIEQNKINLKYSKSENLLYEETKIGNCDFRFLIGFKYGMLSSTYMPLNNDESEGLYGYSLRRIVEDLNPTLIDSLEYPYPLSSSNEDLEAILNEYLELYKKFKDKFIKKD